jgi:acetyltransferase-like isoleucine patch superfamily enzyme
MRALIIVTGRRITPFLEAPGEALYGDGTVGAHLRRLLEKRGLEVVVVDGAVPAGSGPAVVVADHLFVSEKCLGDFLGAAFDVATATQRPARLALAKTPSVEFALPLSSATTEPFDVDGPGARQTTKETWATKREAAAVERVAYDCFFVGDVEAGVTGVALLQRLREQSVRVVVKKGELNLPVRLPTLGDGNQQVMLIPVTSTLCLHVEHWTHVLWLNQAAFGARWLEVLRDHTAWCVVRGLAVLPRLLLTRNPAVVLGGFTRLGKNARIHPTASIEASIIGDNVVVGARASVRSSVLGDNVVVGDHASVISSTLGNDVVVTPRTFVVWSAAYPSAVISNYKLQVSLIGKGASLSTWAGFIDAKLQGTVDVMHDGRLQSTGRSFLGSCLGHGAHVGAKVLLLPGREVPNGTFIAMRDDELVREVPAELPPGVPLVRDQGTLAPLSSATGS